MATTIVATSFACRNDALPLADETQSSQMAASHEDDAQEGDDDSEQKYSYSPFVVKLEGGHFNTVSFKDVGLDRETKSVHDPLLEVISESFTYQLAHHDEFDYQGHVIYDEDILDPSNHLYCGINHLYVDVWQSPSPDRWGFSLWSGCSELDNFAWREVPATASDEDLTAYVAPLTAGIVDALAKAASSNCFQKSC